jgi:hypothetical protein
VIHPLLRNQVWHWRRSTRQDKTTKSDPSAGCCEWREVRQRRE